MATVCAQGTTWVTGRMRGSCHGGTGLDATLHPVRAMTLCACSLHNRGSSENRAQAALVTGPCFLVALLDATLPKALLCCTVYLLQATNFGCGSGRAGVLLETSGVLQYPAVRQRGSH